MNRILSILLCLCFVCGCENLTERGKPSDVITGEIDDVSFTRVHLKDKFWAPRMEINRTISIPSAFYQSEINGRFDNFALAGGLIEGEHQGDFSFDDTDPYKIIEGASYSLAVKYDPALDAYLDSVITLIAAAQEDDGYLTTCVTNRCTRLSGWWGSSRWERVNSHELYNSGHLYEAAVAHYKATGKRSLLDVAVKNADLVCEVFGLGDDQISYPSGHPIIEMALVKLYRVTGEERYLQQARYFVDEAGRLSNRRAPGIYSQDHMPILAQEEIVGHAVRAGYLFAGAADVAMLQHDRELFEAVERLWQNMAGRKLYITGGVGSRAQGEGYGPDYELNNFNNYCETCAAIANVFWNHRMFLASGEAKYIDVLERTLYNGLISGVSLSGDEFFYDNPLASNGIHEREEWFGCACCPGNITRFMASVPGYLYATRNNEVYVNLFVESNSSIALQTGEIELEQLTSYPWLGEVEIRIKKTIPEKFTLHLRIPGWARGRPVPTDLYHYVDGEDPHFSLSVNGKQLRMNIVDGYVLLERRWNDEDVITLQMDMPVRRIAAHEQVAYNRGLLAMERGPVVYALEG
ncbi:MAG: glycoside hydrolase family 127 protein, partial [Bacteroidales bacterium]|nr:glycoside hydrolase family 127 protein [Bacteroidales bacterium]